MSNISGSNVLKKIKNRSNKNVSYEWKWDITYIILTLAIIILVGTVKYFLVMQWNKIEFTKQLIARASMDADRDTVSRYDSSPKGILDMPTQEGAPVSTEGPPDSSENTYLTLYGSPDAPGFRKPNPYQRYISNYKTYGDGLRGNQDSTLGYAPYPGWKNYEQSPVWSPYSTSNPLMGDYYLKAEMANIPRRNLNTYIQQENSYIRDVNRRVRQINRNRMYDPQYLLDKAKLRQLRGFERRLANKVHCEAKEQPYLSDQSPVY